MLTYNVLMISFFGPQHGRTIQAKYNEPGKLQVWKTKCFNLMTNNDEYVNLFLSFIMSKPRMGVKLEFPES